MLTKDFLRGRRRGDLTDEEIGVLEGAIGEVRELPARQRIIHTGERVHQSILLLDGLMCRYMDDREGERQLVALHIAGDFVDLHGFPLRVLDHDVATLTDARVALVPHDRLKAIVAEHPNLTRVLWFSTLLDAAMHREWIFRLGRLGARGRIAHFFCEIAVRLKAIGRGDGQRFPLAINQMDLGEACGLTSVHINRVLRQLREEEIVVFRDGVVDILDWQRLVIAAEFEPGYLYLDD